MHTLRRVATVLIWPGLALGTACDRLDSPTAVVQFGVGTGVNPGKVTGGGQINVLVNDVAGTGTFGFNARREGTDGPVSGHINYINHVTGVHLNCEVESGGIISAPGEEPGTASFGGYECSPNSTFSNFIFTVVDNGEPGRNDTFTIQYDTDDGTVIDGVGPIRSGNIQIHKNQ